MKKYATEVRVIYADTDAMGIVYYGNYIMWFEKGRTEFLRQIGYPYKKVEEQGIYLPVAAVECTYKKPSVYDDLLEIRTWIKEYKAATIIMEYEIVNKETGEVCVVGTSKHAFTNHDLKPLVLKKVNPELYKKLIESMEKEEN